MNRDREEELSPAAEDRREEEVEKRTSTSLDDALRALEQEEPLSLAEEIAAENRRHRQTTPTTATNRSSSRATPTSPSCSGCRWPS